MASSWWPFGRNPSLSSNPSATRFFQLSQKNIDEIVSLASPQSHQQPLNAYQCQSMSLKLMKIWENIEILLKASGVFVYPTTTFTTATFENLFRVSQRAKEIVEDCCSSDWCLASIFQIHNEEAFKEILLDTSLCYNIIYDITKGLNKDHISIEDLRSSSTFDPPTLKEVMQDQMALIKRYTKFIDGANSSNLLTRRQHLAKYLLKRLNGHRSKSNTNSKDFDVCNLKLWQDGKSPDDEWGKQSEFLGGCVCKRTWLDVPCAQKVIEDCTPEDGILTEARILASLNHPNIVKFICCGHDDKHLRHFIAMEAMEQGLHSIIKKRARLKNGPPFTLLSAIDIMLQIASGTSYLHENGIAHRDLKTCNVVVHLITTPHLQEYLQVKLVDFGLSKVNLKASNSNTISFPKRGTTRYMPPEVFHDGRANWFKADAYSFGIMCSVILSGEEPFESIQRTKIYEAISRGERPRLPQDIPQDLASLIKKCWGTNQQSRPKFVEICTRLAMIKHNLLRGECLPHNIKDNGTSSNLYIQERILQRSYARKAHYLHDVHSKSVSFSSKSLKEIDGATTSQGQQQRIDEATTSQGQHQDERNPKLRYYPTNSMQVQHQLQAPQIQPIECFTSVFWDINSCPLPKEVNPEDAANNIQIALRKHPHVRAITMLSAYGTFKDLPKKFRLGCQRSGINLIDAPNGRIGGAIWKAIFVDMGLFALDNHPPSIICLITGDESFASALHKLGQRGYVVILVIPDEVEVSSTLAGAGRFVYDWKHLYSGEGFQSSRHQHGSFNSLYQMPF